MINVLVTGVGAIIGYGIIKSLRQCELDVNVIGMDIYIDAVGKKWCNKFINSIPAKDNNYIKFLNNTINDNNIDIVMFGTEQEIYKVNGAKDEMGENFKKCVINKSNILDLSEDKWKMYEYLKQNGIDIIPTEIECDYKLAIKKFGKNIIMKPRKSYASKGIIRIFDEDDFNYAKKKANEQFMIQKIVGDNEHEYTVGIFGYGDGTTCEPIILKRVLSNEGATAKAYLYNDDKLKEEINRYVKLLKPIGPTNLQFRKDKDKYYLLEVNPRISSSTSIRTSLGYNEAYMSIMYYLYNKKINIKIKDGYAIRFIDEVVYYDSNNI